MVRRRTISKRAIHALRPALRLIVWPLQGLALALFWSCCRAMSPARAAAFGARLGRAFGPHLRWHGRLRANLAIALPHAPSERVEALAQAAWSSFGTTLAEHAHFGTIVGSDFDEHVEVVLAPGLEACRGRPARFVFVTAHLGNWEIAPAAARRLGLPLTVVYSPRANPIVDWQVQRRRRDLGCRFLASDDSIRPLLNELRAGRSIGLLVDLRVESGAALPFCGQPTTTTLVPARLALKFGCPLIPVRVERLQPARFRVTAEDAVLPDAAAPPALQARQMMAQVNARFESWIVARPYEWQCFQNRWPQATRERVLKDRTQRASRLRERQRALGRGSNRRRPLHPLEHRGEGGIK
ncbi:MAG TPA: lysophospholipid acyltransferase family protein [Geminicoccaceae bacterium]|nr:lysophospholipid acyltransferase family protein [Geminicoccaceae bacterium]